MFCVLMWSTVFLLCVFIKFIRGKTMSKDGKDDNTKIVAVQISQPDDHKIIEHIKSDGGNLSHVIRKLLRNYRDNGYKVKDNSTVI